MLKSMQRFRGAAADSQISDPKIHVPFGGPAVIKAGHEQEKAETLWGGGYMSVVRLF